FDFAKTEIYHRLPENAQDTSSTESVMLEYLERTKVDEDDVFILVQATSPLTSSADFQNAISYYRQDNADSLLTGVRFKRFLWDKDGTPKNYDYTNRPRRQDFEGEFMENGAFYINKVSNVLRDKNRLSGKIALYEMPEYTAFEIDEPDDWNIAEQLMKRHILQKEQSKQIKLFLTDVDGVLTDSGMYYTENGDEFKKFNTRDGMGLELLRNNGITAGILALENGDIVSRRGKELKVDFLYQGKREGGKLEAAKQICTQEGIYLHEVAYIGDDIKCYDLLNSVGLAPC